MGANFTFLLISIYIMQGFNYAAVSTNRLSQHFRVANSLKMPAEDGIMSLLGWLSLTHPLLVTNDFDNPGYYIHQTIPNVVKILRQGYTTEIKVLQSTSLGFPLASPKRLKTIQKA